MGKKKDAKRARKAAKAAMPENRPEIINSQSVVPIRSSKISLSVPILKETILEHCSRDETVVSTSMFLTKANRVFLRRLAIDNRTSLQRLGHQAWNLFLESHGLPALTPVNVRDLDKKIRRGQS